MRKIKYAGIAAATLLTIAPVVVTPATVKAATQQTTTNVQGQNQAGQPANVQGQSNNDQPANVQGQNSGDQQRNVQGIQQVTPTPYGWHLNLGNGWYPGKYAIQTTSKAINKVEQAIAHKPVQKTHAAPGTDQGGKKTPANVNKHKAPLIIRLISDAGDTLIKFADEGQRLLGKKVVNKDTGEEEDVVTISQLFDSLSNSNYGSGTNSAVMPSFSSINGIYGKSLDASGFSSIHLQDLGVDDKDGTFTKDINQLLKLGYKIKFGDTDKYSAADFAKLVNTTRENGHGAHFDLPVTLYDPKGTSVYSKDLVFTNNAAPQSVVTQMNIKYDTPINVEVGSSTVKYQLSGEGHAVVTDQNGDPIDYTADPGYFYSSETEARKGDNSTSLKSPTFSKKGATYYQPVTLTFAKGKNLNVGTLLQNMDKDKSNSIKLNGTEASQADVNNDKNSVTFIREITVGAEKTQISDNNEQKQPAKTNNDDGVIKGDWKINKKSGVVTVNNKLARLYNDDNNLTSRSLAPDTDWKTDQYRTNVKTGEIQYRVSTHEWVNALAVTESEAQGNEISGGLLTNISNLNGHNTVNLAGPKGFVYALFSKDGKRSSHGLAGESG